MTRRFAIASLALVAVATFATPAGAHSQLLQSTPAPDSSLQAPPTAVELTFTEAVDISGQAIRVFSERGARVDSGVATQPDDVTVSTKLVDLPSGGYLVAWRATSADGHPVSGSFTFQVEDGTRISEARASELLSNIDDETIASVTLGIGRGFALLAMLALGTAMMASFFGEAHGMAKRAIAIAAILGIGSMLAAMFGTAAGLTGLGFAAMSDSAALGEALRSETVMVSVLRGLLPLILFAWIRLVPKSGPALWLRVALAVAGFAVTSAHIGHANSGRLAALALATHTLHWGLIALWCGGLLAIALQWNRWTAERRCAVLTSVSPAFLAAVAIIVGTGVFQTWRLLPDLGSLATITYGRMVALKAVAMAAVVIVAAGNRGMLLDLRSALGAEEFADGERQIVAERSQRSLRRGILAELVLVTLISGAAIVLGGSAPYDQLSQVPGASYTARTTDDQFSVTLDVSSLRTGNVELHITAANTKGVPPPPQQLSVSMYHPAQSVDNFEQRVFILGPGHIQTVGTAFPFGGLWKVAVEIRTDEFTSSRAVFDVDIP